MKNHGKSPLLTKGRIEGALPIRERYAVGSSVEMKSLPIAGDGRWKLPAQPADHIRVGVILDRRLKGRKRRILAEFLGAIRVDDQFSGKRGIGRREQVHDRGIDGQK